MLFQHYFGKHWVWSPFVAHNKPKCYALFMNLTQDFFGKHWLLAIAACNSKQRSLTAVERRVFVVGLMQPRKYLILKNACFCPSLKLFRYRYIATTSSRRPAKHTSLSNPKLWFLCFVKRDVRCALEGVLAQLVRVWPSLTFAFWATSLT